MYTVKSIIELNPQIKSAHIRWNLNSEMLETISELKHLKTLKISCFSKSLNIPDDINFRSVKKFYLNVMNDDKFRNIPFTFDGLESFTASSNYSNKKEFLDFFKKNPSITKLKIALNSHAIMPAEKSTNKNFAEFLPCLKEVYTDKYILSGHEALNCIQHLKFLNKFHFTIKESYSLDGLKERLPGWQATMDDGGLVKLQRLL